MDAAILFSDILVVPEAMGQTIAFPEGGPTVTPPVRTAADLAKLVGGTPKEVEQDERRRQLLRLLAEIEKRVNEDSAAPKKR